MLDANRKYLALLLRKILLRKQQGFVNYLAHAVKMTSFVSLERPPCLHYEHNSRVNINIPGTLTPISNKLMMKFFAPVFRSSNQIIVTPRKSWASHRSLNIWIIWSRFFWFMWITHCKSKHYYSYCRNSWNLDPSCWQFCRYTVGKTINIRAMIEWGVSEENLVRW